MTLLAAGYCRAMSTCGKGGSKTHTVVASYGVQYSIGVERDAAIEGVLVLVGVQANVIGTILYYALRTQDILVSWVGIILDT